MKSGWLVKVCECISPHKPLPPKIIWWHKWSTCSAHFSIWFNKCVSRSRFYARKWIIRWHDHCLGGNYHLVMIVYLSSSLQQSHGITVPFLIQIYVLSAWSAPVMWTSCKSKQRCYGSVCLVLVSQGSHNNAPQPEWLQQQKCNVLQLWRPEISDQSVGKVSSFWRSLCSMPLS